MGKFRPKIFGFTVFAIFSVVAILLITTNGDGGIGAIIPPPALELVTINDPQFGEFTAIQNPDGTITTGIFGDELILPNVACWIAQETKVFQFRDQRDLNRPLFVLKSPFFTSNPLIGVPLGSITDTATQIELNSGVWVTSPQIKCVSGEISTELGAGFAPIGEIDPDDPNLFSFFPSVSTPLTVQDSFFKIFVYASLPNGTWKEVFNAHYTVQGFDITNAQANVLKEQEIRQEWIEPYLPEGDYNSEYRIVYDGAFLLNWKLSSICGTDCAKIPFVIPIITEKTFNEEGQIVSVFNEFQVSRDVTIGKPDGSGEIDITCDEVTEELDPLTGICTPIPPSQQVCKEGQVRSGGVCVTISGGGNNPNDTSVDPNDLLQLLSTCLASGDPTCLASTKFLPLWIFGVGLIVVVGAMAQSRQPEIYGVPRSGF